MALLNKIRSISFSFLWSGRQVKSSCHLIAWKLIALPFEADGWGIRNVYWSYRELHLKSLWRALTHSCPWIQLMCDKYLKVLTVIAWIRQQPMRTVGASNIWRGLVETFPTLQAHLGWQVGNGFQVWLGVKLVLGCDKILLLGTFILLHQMGYNYLNHAKNPLRSGSTNYWLFSYEIGLSGEAGNDWNQYILKLSHASIALNYELDILKWSWQEDCGDIAAGHAYSTIAEQHHLGLIQWWYRFLWRWNVPLKLHCFIWLTFKNSILTADNYIRKGGYGPNVCSFCFQAAKTVHHLFSGCLITLQLWSTVSELWGIDFCWNHDSIADVLHKWYQVRRDFISFPIYFIWGIWKL